MADAHPGFAAASNDIAKREGVSEKSADAILASQSRKASPAAKKANPRLNRVKGGGKKPGPEDRRSAIERRMRGENKMNDHDEDDE